MEDLKEKLPMVIAVIVAIVICVTGLYFFENYKLRAKCRILKIKVSEKKIYPGDQISCTGRLSAI